MYKIGSTLLFLVTYTQLNSKPHSSIEHTKDVVSEKAPNILIGNDFKVFQVGNQETTM